MSSLPEMRSADPAEMRWNRLGPALRARVDQILVLVALIAIWQTLTLLLGVYWVGSPWGVLTRVVSGVFNGDLLRHASFTAGEAAAGFVLGAIPAAALPFLLRRMPIVTAIVDPFMVGGYGAPKLALAPLFILWFGIGIWSKIALVAITVFFIVYFSALAGIRTLDTRLVQMAQVMGASERDVARHIVFPGAVPYIFTGLRIAMPYSIGGAVIAELISANRGLGYLVQLGAMNFDTTGVFAALVAVTCIVFLGNWSVNAVERRLLRWRPVSEFHIAGGHLIMADAPLLEIRALSKRFATRAGREPSPWVIQDLSFSVSDGEFLTIVGPSGAGKTTLLNMIAQIDVASGGEVRFQSESAPIGDPKALDPGLSCRIGYVTQEDNLLPWRTTLQNVLFPLDVQGRLNAETRARAELLIRTVGLAGFEGHYPHELSGGMRKRASLIRTLVYDPPVILMDEPFGALDAQTRAQLQEDLLRLWNLGRKTIVFVTHDIAEAIALGDRTLVLSRAPSRIAGEHQITIPRPRDIRGIMTDPRFAALYQSIRAQVQ